MTNKNTFVIIGILAVLLLSFGMVSATHCLDIISVDVPTSVNHDIGTIDFSFNVSHVAGCGNRTDIDITFTTANAGTFSAISLFNLSVGDIDKTINAQFDLDTHQNGNIIITVNQDTAEGLDDSEDLTNIAIASESELTISLEDDLTKTQDGTVKVENTGNVDLSSINLAEATSSDFTVQFNESDFTLPAGDSILVKVSSLDVEDLTYKNEKSLDIKATSGTLDSNLLTLSVESPFYEGENNGNLKTTIDRVDLTGFGSDEEYWYPFDEIELKVNIENAGSSDVENIDLELCLLDVAANKCVFTEEEMDLEEEAFDIDSDNDNNVIVSFKIDASELRDGNTDYKLYVGAIGKVDDRDSEYDNEETGDSVYMDIEIRTDEAFVIVNDINLMDLSNYLEDSELSCGNEVMVTAKAWNVGEEDLDNDKVFVKVYNRELGINEVISFNNGINAMDYELIELSFVIPENAIEKAYSIEFSVYDDDDFEDRDIYKNQEDDKSKFSGFLRVSNCVSPVIAPNVDADLESEAKIGEELIIKAIVTNNDEEGSFVISASGFEDWAKLVSISPQVVSIKKGEYAEVTITLKPTVSGEHSFSIDTLLNGESNSQPVKVSIDGKFQLFSQIDNKVLYLVIGAAGLFIILFLALIIKVSKKKVSPQF